MTSDLTRGGFVVATTAGGGALATVAVPADHAATIVVLVTAVGVVAAGIAWIDKRIESRLRRHEEGEAEKFATLQALNTARYESRGLLEQERHDRLMAEITHVKERIDIRGEIRALRSSLRATEEDG